MTHTLRASIRALSGNCARHSTAAVSSKPRHLISISSLSPAELGYLVDRASHYRHLIKADSFSIGAERLTLLGHTITLLFSKRSTRTRVSSEVAINYLGGHPMFLGRDDIQLGVNESLYDTSRVISSVTSAIVARVGPHSDIVGLSAASSVPVINALCDTYHPLQAIADILTIKESFKNLAGLKLAWVGDANNVLNDLATACAMSGINVSVATPSAYPVNSSVFANVREAASVSGVNIEVGHDPLAAVKHADVIVTDTWISMGQESEKQLRMQQFAGFQVTSQMANKGGAKNNWKFMHCLPRKPLEVSDEVFYSDRSLVFDEAENRLYAMLAALDGFVVKQGKLE
ncbi:Aspartate/ornithine carbamoyltransferase [Lipomyces chichibuensis]|uniref:Aspartate/ornithine carbamoyltransferase n=1 Tax=Lipomyces chichibuensis TaxID=1546026 RepID=UPI003342F32D